MSTKMKRTDTAKQVVEKPEPAPVTVDANELIRSILDTKKPTDRKYILCRSITVGGLNINCRSGNVYEFKRYGDECEIEKEDLIALIRKRSEHIFKPRFIIIDDEFLEDYPQVSQVYDGIYSLSDLNKVFTLEPAVMIAEIQKMPMGVQENLKNMISTKIANGSLDSLKRIKALSDYYNSDFNLLGELFNK